MTRPSTASLSRKRTTRSLAQTAAACNRRVPPNSAARTSSSKIMVSFTRGFSLFAWAFETAAEKNDDISPCSLKRTPPKTSSWVSKQASVYRRNTRPGLESTTLGPPRTTRSRMNTRCITDSMFPAPKVLHMQARQSAIDLRLSGDQAPNLGCWERSFREYRINGCGYLSHSRFKTADCLKHWATLKKKCLNWVYTIQMCNFYNSYSKLTNKSSTTRCGLFRFVSETTGFLDPAKSPVGMPSQRFHRCSSHGSSYSIYSKWIASE